MQTYSKRLALFIQRLEDVLPWAQIEEAAEKTWQYGNPTESDLSGREKELAQRLGYSVEEQMTLRAETSADMATLIENLQRELRECQETLREQEYKVADWRLASMLPLERARLELKRAADAALAELSKPEKAE